MITLLTGATGSGKTYRAVHDIIDDLKTGRKIYTNIKLNIEDENYHYIDEIQVQKFLDEIYESFNGHSLEKAKENYQKSEYANAKIVLDEVQFLGMKTYSKPISDWLTLHRHFGQDVVLITQIIKNLSPVYQDLCHKHIEYRSPTNRLLSSHFQYTEYDSVKGEKLTTKMQKPNLDYFEIYKTGKAEGATHPLMLKLIAVVVGLFAMAYYLIFSDSSVVNVVNPNMEKTTMKIENIEVKTIIPKVKEKTEKEEIKIDDNATLIENCNVVMENKVKKCSPNYVLCISDGDLFTELRKECSYE